MPLWNTTKISLKLGVPFIDEVYNTFYLNTDYSQLLNKKVLIGGSFDSLELVNNSNEKHNVSTLIEWEEAK